MTRTSKKIVTPVVVRMAQWSVQRSLVRMIIRHSAMRMKNRQIHAYMREMYIETEKDSPMWMVVIAVAVKMDQFNVQR